MKTRSWVRLTLFTVCLAAYLWHIGGHLIYSTGLRNYTNINATIAAHLNKEYQYSIHHPLLQSKEALLFYNIYPEDTFYVIQQRLVARNLPVNIEQLEFYAKLAPQNEHVDKLIATIKNNDSTNIMGNLELTYDDRCRLIGVDSHYEILGIACGVKGFVDHNGLHADITVADLGLTETYEDKLFNPDNIHGIALLLPPNLETGQLVNLRIVSNEIQLEVGAKKTVMFGGKQQELFQGGLIHGGKAYAHVWFDEKGVIYRLKIINRSIVIDLKKILNPDGETLWASTP